MTDIRVIRPACEKVFGPGVYNTSFLEIALTNYFLARPDENMPICEDELEGFIDKFMTSPEAVSLFRWHFPLKTTTKHVNKKQLRGWWGDYFTHSFQPKIFRMQEAIRGYFLKPEKDRLIYIFEGRFFDQFSKIDIKNLTGKHLPQSGTGCIVLPRPIKISPNPSMPESNQIDELLFHVGHTSFLNRVVDSYEEKLARWCEDPNADSKIIPQTERLLPYYLNVHDPDSPRLFVVGLNSKTRVPEFYAEYNIAWEGGFKNVRGWDDYPSEDDENCGKVVLNLLAYINSGKPDIREFRNEIHYRGKSTVHVRPEDEDLSRGKIHLVGFNWLKNPVYAIDGWYSSGYMSWRMCGPGKSVPRLVYFSPSFKQRRKGNENTITEEGASEENFTEC